MNRKVAKFLLNALGWKAIEPTVPEPKCIILGAPHTSTWDFPISYLYYSSVGGKANILIKSGAFKGPLKPLLKSLGAIPVVRNRTSGASLVMQIIEAFDNAETMHLAIAPEGTRTGTERWKTGFHTIARKADIPVYLGYFDWKTKTVGRGVKFELTDDANADLKKIRQWYKDKGVVGKYPEKFITGKDLD